MARLQYSKGEKCCCSSKLNFTIVKNTFVYRLCIGSISNISFFAKCILCYFIYSIFLVSCKRNLLMYKIGRKINPVIVKSQDDYFNFFSSSASDFYSRIRIITSIQRYNKCCAVQNCC